MEIEEEKVDNMLSSTNLATFSRERLQLERHAEGRRYVGERAVALTA